VLTSREHIIALEPLDKGLMGTLLRYPYEVRDEKEYFDEIQDVKVTKDMLDLAKHIVTQKTAEFEPEKFEGQYEEAITELINAKRNGKTVGPKPRPRGENVVHLMDALKKSLATETTATKRQKAPEGRRRSEGNAASDRGEEARSKEGGQARTFYRTPQSWVATLLATYRSSNWCSSWGRLKPIGFKPAITISAAPAVRGRFFLNAGPSTLPGFKAWSRQAGKEDTMATEPEKVYLDPVMAETCKNITAATMAITESSDDAFRDIKNILLLNILTLQKTYDDRLAKLEAKGS
jgi:hypothetical protein